MSAHHGTTGHVFSAVVATFTTIGSFPWHELAGEVAGHVGIGLGAGFATWCLTQLAAWVKQRLFKGEKK